MDINTIATDLATVNAVIQANPGVLVLLHWYDMDEVSVPCEFGGGIKYKFPIEVQCFAVGVLTGEPIHDKPWGDRHTKWILPVTAYQRTVVSQEGLHFEPVGEYPQNLGGTYPSLDVAEATGYDPEVWRSIRDHRRAQIIVGKDNINTWLEHHEEFRHQASKWFADILRHSGAMATT